MGQAAWFYQRTGVPVHAMSPLLKLAWFRENDPAIFNKAHKFIGIKEYIVYRLTGQFVMDTSIASATGLLNRETLDWDAEILERQAIEPAKLPEVVSTKSVYKVREGNDLPQELQGISLVIGASDGALANLGTGATGTNLAVTIGTSGAARLMVKHSMIDEAMRTFCYHVKDDFYIIGGGSNNGAVVLQWLKEQLLETDESYEELLNLASEVAAGSSGLIMLPYILGERAPLWNAGAKGVFFGITKQHGKAHFLRAAVEAVIFCMYSIAKILLEKNRITAVYASGGVVKSKLWLQVMADVFGLPVHVSGATGASAFGAVILGAEALNIPCNFDNRIIGSFYPSETNFEVYRQSFKKFERLFAMLEDEMSDNS
jgi:gluconokinase